MIKRIITISQKLRVKKYLKFQMCEDIIRPTSYAFASKYPPRMGSASIGP